MRALILTHRYLGIAIGLVMVLWCLSGFVMMYEGFPSLDNDKRVRALDPLSWNTCCAFDKLSTKLGVDAIDSFSVEMLGGRPVLVTAMTRGRRQVFDLISGEILSSINEAQALDVATQFASTSKAQGSPRYIDAVDVDQWTVQGQFRRDRPLHHIALGDDAGTEVYVSGKTGRVVQHTNSHQRFWNWLGAIPHWLYPTALRQNGALWSQVVIYLSLAGVFLTLMGLYIGVSHWLAAPGSKWSPYRGLNLWHHLSGLFFGVLMLTWVGSGLLSMNPWGLLEGSGAGEERERARDMWIDGRQMLNALESASAQQTIGVTRIVSAPSGGKLYLLLDRGKERTRVEAKTLVVAPLQQSDVEKVAARIVENAEFKVDLLNEGDEYYYSGHDPVELPVYRIAVDNAERTRYYLDAFTGEVLGKVESSERWYRWLFEGLHRFDFTPALRTRPWWDLLVLTLMIGVTIVSLTGVWMGWRRVTKRKV